MEKQTIKERKQALYDATTKARSHFLAVDKRLTAKLEKQHPDLRWWEVSSLVRNEKEWIEANTRLISLCDACNLIGIECGE